MEPIGTELNTLACYVTWAFLFIAIHRGNEIINNSKYHLKIWEMAACKNGITVATKGVVQRDMKEANKDYFLFEIWLSSN